MAIALGFTGWWMYIDVPDTPRAVVFCVIIFNAAFGYSWGPIPWLYPPEVCALVPIPNLSCKLNNTADHALACQGKGCLHINSYKLGI